MNLAWMSQAACIGEDPELFFPVSDMPSPQLEAARAVCVRCPVAESCHGYAVAEGLVGVWGGTTAAERRAMSRAPQLRESWTEAEDALLGEMAKRRAPAWRIAEELGRKEHSVYARARKIGVRLSSREWRGWTDHESDLLMQMVSAGVSYGEIAERLRRSKESIKKRVGALRRKGVLTP